MLARAHAADPSEKKSQQRTDEK